VVHYIRRYKKNIAVDMRRRGSSYSEIEKKLHVPKSTLNFWLQNLKLTPEQIESLSQRRSEIARANAEKKILKTRDEIETIKVSSSRDIRNISKRELWFMGILLCWRERFIGGTSLDLFKGLHFTSSDKYLIKLFLKWLEDVGGLGENDLRFDVFTSEKIKKNKEELEALLQYWAEVTGFSRWNFTHVYAQKERRRKRLRKTKRTEHGLLRIRVKSSSMLARQVAGWIQGIQQYYWKEARGVYKDTTVGEIQGDIQSESDET